MDDEEYRRHVQRAIDAADECDRMIHELGERFVREPPEEPSTVDIFAAMELMLIDDDDTGAPRRVRGQDAIAALRLIPHERDDLDRVEQTMIEVARDAGETWESLARTLGRTSAQAMQQRYKRLGGTKSWPTRRAPVTDDR